MDVFREKYLALVDLYAEHADQVRTLQELALREIRSDLEVHLGLGVSDLNWAEDYLRDTGSIFRLFRRHKFIVPFTHEALHHCILWRISTLKPAFHKLTKQSSLLSHHDLPVHPSLSFGHSDSLGRPIAILRVARLDLYSDRENVKAAIMLSLEKMRLTLHELNDTRSGNDLPVLQFVLIVDLEGVTLKSVPVDLVAWYTREIQSWYYGLIGASLVINFNWAHAGLWAILKPLLPSSSVAKVAFLNEQELLQYMPDFYMDSVVHEQDDDIYDNNILATSSSSPDSTVTIGNTALEGPGACHSSPGLRKVFSFACAMALPFSMQPDTSRVQNAKKSRHKWQQARDFAYNLLALYWRRWHKELSLLLAIITVVVVVKARSSKLFIMQYI